MEAAILKVILAGLLLLQTPFTPGDTVDVGPGTLINQGVRTTGA